MSSLLINESPLTVLPSLAVKIGLNEAIVLQQIHYWMGRSKNERDGLIWVYKTYDEWKDEFPFWSTRTIQRTINSLEGKNLVISTNEYNKMKIDRTKWYRINYQILESLSRQNDVTKTTNCHALGDDNLSCRSRQNDETNNHRLLTENTTEITDNKDNVADAPVIPFKEIVDYLNERSGKQYRSSGKKTQGLIKARFKEGFTLTDFQKVIDHKCGQWKGGKMDQYLRPETLFGTKFEGYLNERGADKGGTHQQYANSHPAEHFPF